MHDNENELLQQVIKGDESAFKKLYQVYQGKIFGYAWKLTKSKDIAGEVVQSVFIKLWQKRADIDPLNNFEGYVIRTTQNHIFNLLRDAAREKERRFKIWQNTERINYHPEDDLYAKELAKVYHEAIELLPPQKKIVYRLREQQALSYIDISKKLGVSPLTVKKHMAEAVRLIRAHVKGNSHLEFSFLLFWMLA